MPLLHPGIKNRLWNDTLEDYLVQFFNWQVEGKAQRPSELPVVAKQVSRSQVVTQQVAGPRRNEEVTTCSPGELTVQPTHSTSWPLWWLILCQLDWVPKIWLNLASECVCASVPKQDYLVNWWIGVKHMPFPSLSGHHPTHWGPEKNERAEENWIIFLPNYWDGYQFSPASTLLVLQPSDSCWNLHHHLLALKT